MFSEQTLENSELINVGIGTDFFGIGNNIIEKCHFYVVHPAAKKKIVEACHWRSVRPGIYDPAYLFGVLRTLSMVYGIPDGTASGAIKGVR